MRGPARACERIQSGRKLEAVGRSARRAVSSWGDDLEGRVEGCAALLRGWKKEKGSYKRYLAIAAYPNAPPLHELAACRLLRGGCRRGTTASAEGRGLDWTDFCFVQGSLYCSRARGGAAPFRQHRPSNHRETASRASSRVLPVGCRLGALGEGLHGLDSALLRVVLGHLAVLGHEDGRERLDVEVLRDELTLLVTAELVTRAQERDGG